jgi:hypothetical protein
VSLTFGNVRANQHAKTPWRRNSASSQTVSPQS